MLFLNLRRQSALLLAALAFLALALALFGAPALAHDIPIEAKVQMFVKPDGKTLKVLIRLPLTTYTDAEYPRRNGDYVDLAKVDSSLKAAATVMLVGTLKMYENGRLLPAPHITSARMALDSDLSFLSYTKALAHVTGPPLPPQTDIFWEQGKLDVLFDYPMASPNSKFTMHAAFDRLAQHEVTTVQFLQPDGVTRAFELEGDAGMVPLDPNWFQAAGRFVVMGFKHILEGTDHLLFLLCLVIPFRRIRPLVPIVTAFTIAHSITLIASAYNYAPDVLWFPPLIELLIAISIVYMALENIVVEHPARRWIITFCFGLVHGFGFSFVLRNTLQFAGSHVLSSLLAFNVGVELGQLLMLAIFVPALNLLFRYGVAQRLGTIILSALVAHQAWHWMMERLEALQQFPWPKITNEGLASAFRWAIAAAVTAALVWLVAMFTARWEKRWDRGAPKTP